MAPAPSASAFPLHPNSCLLDEHDRMLFQHSHPTGTDAERTTLQEGVEGFSAAISKAIQPQSHALHLDQRAGTLPTHHRSNERVPGSSSQATKAAEDQPNYYKELTVRCTRQPFHLSLQDDSLFAFAGLWDRWKDTSGQVVESCSILTTTPNALLANVHDRMPVILRPEAYDLWLDPGFRRAETLKEMLNPFDATLMKRYPVSTRVNFVRNDDPQCAAAIHAVN